MISDLAPLAPLLQRAGRGHRHQLGKRGARPAWASAPRQVVCSPSGSLPPPAWGKVYDAALLHRTRELLADQAGQPLDVPGEVAEAIETVYADLNDLADQALADDRQRAVRETAQAAAATCPTTTSTPSPKGMGTHPRRPRPAPAALPPVARDGSVGAYEAPHGSPR
ncbi:hypothetical protein ADL21_05270 [Streptomyces albus subsp. albus]|nr:hypothetical protein ADL21_05270 [Streptomyces albus subsp. albus]